MSFFMMASTAAVLPSPCGMFEDTSIEASIQSFGGLVFSIRFIKSVVSHKNDWIFFHQWLKPKVYKLGYVFSYAVTAGDNGSYSNGVFLCIFCRK